MNSTKGETRLTTDGAFKSDPVYLHDGAELVYAVQETPSLLALRLLKLADGSTTRLHPAATTSEFEPSFSADGRIEAFVQSRSNLNLKLMIRDTRAGRDAIFDPGGGFAGIRRPTCAPDGRRVVFAMPSPTGQEIVSVDALGKDRKTLTQGGINGGPAFSPDGKRIAFVSSRDGTFDLYVMAADGSDVHRITKGIGMCLRPAWSPDGRRLAFTGTRDGNYEIYIIDIEGSNLVRVTHNDERDDYVCWQPDGKRLVFVGERDGRFDLVRVEVV